MNLANEIKISASVFLDSLTPEDVSVQILSGRVDASGEIIHAEITSMGKFENEGNACYRFHASVHTAKSGFFGYAIRSLPNHPDGGWPGREPGSRRWVPQPRGQRLGLGFSFFSEN